MKVSLVTVGACGIDRAIAERLPDDGPRGRSSTWSLRRSGASMAPSCSVSLSHHHAAVDVENVAGDRTRLVAAQKDDRLGDLFGFACPAYWNAF